ncbi:MAG TPA: Mur ligase family protein, partial [Streptosporangiaceae bacterium]|nr:Mur ligase family protein [Streptosporangiaceae bacterium]
MPAALRPRYVPVRPLTGLAALLGLRQPDSDSSFIHHELRGVSGVTHDSSAVRPGDLYVALPGSRYHGASFCDKAAAAGAVAVLTDADGRERAIRCGLPVFVVTEPRARLGEVAAWVYGDPSGKLLLIGVTGTSGKTTTTYLIESGLRMAGHVTGLVGGVETRIGAAVEPSKLTTPEATDLQAAFAVMAERKVTAAVMEVSSHALAFGRVAGTSFEVAVFTNLSQDHLDFHQDMDSYFAAKAELFTPRYARSAVVNVDDPRGRRLANRAHVPVTTYSAA